MRLRLHAPPPPCDTNNPRLLQLRTPFRLIDPRPEERRDDEDEDTLIHSDDLEGVSLSARGCDEERQEGD